MWTISQPFLYSPLVPAVFHTETGVENIFRTETSAENIFHTETSAENIFHTETSAENIFHIVISGYLTTTYNFLRIKES